MTKWEGGILEADVLNLAQKEVHSIPMYMTFTNSCTHVAYAAKGNLSGSSRCKRVQHIWDTAGLAIGVQRASGSFSGSTCPIFDPKPVSETSGQALHRSCIKK